MLRFCVALALAAPLAAVPAQAVTWAFGGSSGSFSSLNVSAVGGPTLSVTALGFTPQPSTLTNLSQLSFARQIDRTATGIGVVGGANTQLDTNAPGGSPREAFLLTSPQALEITGVRLSVVDLNDTFQLYGVGAGGALTSLGFSGTVSTGFGGLASAVNTGTITATMGGVSQVTFNSPLTAYSSFVMTTRAGGDVLFGGDRGQGYRLDALSANVVPEPATWAMLVLGFGLVGAALRRRQRPLVALN